MDGRKRRSMGKAKGVEGKEGRSGGVKQGGKTDSGSDRGKR